MKLSLSRPTARPLRAARASTTVARAESVLIANTKGGGHAFIGLHAANALLDAGHTVTILNDGDESKLRSKAPFSQYAALESRGATVLFGNPATPAAALPAGASFDVVLDNNGKDMDACQPLIDAFKGTVKQYMFIGSAGAYVADPIEPGHFEGDARKASAGHVAVEAYLASQGLPYTVFQPLYIYGPHTAKDCEQWFLDRLVRGRPVLLPAPGVQLVTLSHVNDLASMITSAVGKKAAVGQQFNLCADRAVTHAGVVKALAKAAGVEPKIVFYYPSTLKADGFPFRTGHFFANSDKAKRVLGWTCEHDFEGDAPALVAAYKASGRDKKDIDFSADDAVLAAVGAAGTLVAA